MAEYYTFKEPAIRTYRFMAEERPAPIAHELVEEWIMARVVGSTSGNPIRFGKKLSLGLAPWADVEVLLSGTSLKLVQRVSEEFYLLEAPDPWTCAKEAARMAMDPGVVMSVPVARKPIRRMGQYSPAPNDSYFHRQWHLEHREADTGSSTGPDLNVRAAWPVTRGEGVTIAVADDGVDVEHPDLAANMEGGPHFNFVTREEDGHHRSVLHAHGTAVAGLAAAVGGNRLGVSGVAPAARLASWVIFEPGNDIISDEALMHVFQSHSNRVSVQNHSWANSGPEQLGPSALERMAISNAVHFGRSGRGVVIVRAGGNGRDDGVNGNDDGYAADPLIITVGAVRFDSHVASYSTPGPNLLIAAPSGDSVNGQPSLFTTDRVGVVGYNNNAFTNDLADYAFDGSGFSGTSGAAPQISGLVALLLSANTNLTVRDVQQILILSSRQTDRLDPDVRGNGAGLRISHSTGFGVPDAGEAVRLAKRWKSRPAVVEAVVSTQPALEIPDDALRLTVTGPAVPEPLADIPASPGGGLHPDEATLLLPLVHVGLARNPILTSLEGKAALILRGENFFSEKAANAADAGASFAVIYNNRDSDRRILMAGVDFARIPVVFIGERDGKGLRDFLAAGGEAEARLSIRPAVVELKVVETLTCEHVMVTIDAEHPNRGQLRITLVSPAGTRSVMQRVNSDANPGPSEWVYMSTHHFYEPSAGTWRVEVTDEGPGDAGLLRFVELRIRGVAIRDGDRDGLDDAWEQAHFGGLDQGLTGDIDGDGFNHAREQAMGGDPKRAEFEFKLDVAIWKPGVLRLSWPGLSRTVNPVLAAQEASGPFVVLTNIPGRFPETEWFLKSAEPLMRSYFIQAP